MVLSNFLNRFFGRENEASKSVAKERLRLVLVHDRLDMSENVMESLREDLISVIGKYLIIDDKALDVTLTREDNSVALVANIPIINVRPQRQCEPASVKDEVNADKAEPAKTDNNNSVVDKSKPDSSKENEPPKPPAK